MRSDAAKSPTVYDVAKRAGVSIATVSFTFRQPDRVRASTREAVLLAATALGYVPSASARGLARGQTGALGLFAFDYLLDTDRDKKSVPRPTDSPDDFPAAPCDDANKDFRLFPLYVDEVQHGVELECWRRGYALMVGGGNPASSEAVLADIAGRVDGLVVFPRSVPEEALERISRRIPIVEVSEAFRNESLDHVTVDNAGGMHSLTSHLIEVHEMTDLVFVGWMASSDNEARWGGFLEAVLDAGLQPPERPSDGYHGFISAPTYVSSLLGRDALPQALVCATDQDALAVMDALIEAGIEIPRRVAVTGFDGIAAGRMARPALTTVRQPMEQMGRIAVGLLVDRLTDPQKAPVRQQLPVEMLLRESCGCKALVPPVFNRILAD